jgi:hypothetical protein
VQQQQEVSRLEVEPAVVRHLPLGIWQSSGW